MMVRLGDADGLVAGSNSPTADVLKAAIQVIKTAQESILFLQHSLWKLLMVNLEIMD